MKTALQDFYNLINAASFVVGTVGITGLAEQLLKQSGYMDMLRDHADEQAAARVENINEFLSVTQQFERKRSSQTWLA